MKKNLKITLCSDLCAAVGKHYAAIIDLDTALDEYGLPYIPSRRLKGCLREVSNLIFTDDITDNLFGQTGSKESGSLYIGDARIDDYENTVKAIRANANIANPEKVSNLFCSVRNETAIENGTAKDASLRFIRVVNHLSPIDEKPLSFLAPIEFDCNEETIERLAKGLRNIGYHRNRGLGAVKCSIESTENNTLDIASCELKPNTIYELRYTVKLTGDLMLTDTNANYSMDYIPGTTIQGALAGKYIKKYGETDFNNLFISKYTSFGNLYISDSSGNRFTPAPRFLAKIKAASNEDDKGIKNTIGKQDDEKQYKVLKKGYINKEIGYKIPERKIVYHNANTKSQNEQALYMQHCICGGQYFSGTIKSDEKSISIFQDLLSDGTLFLGRSKTAQYARCEVYEAETVPFENKTVKLNKGEIASYVLESDVVLIDKKSGSFSNSLSALCKALNIKDIVELCKETSIATKTISGYNSKWNLKKPQFPVITAGSCVVFNPKKDIILPEYTFIGEKQNEGFGVVKLIQNAEKFEPHSVHTENQNVKINHPVIEAIIRSDKMNSVINDAISFAENIKLNSSQLGRIMLMLKEADRQSTDNYENFNKRITSIKTKSINEKAIEYFGEKSEMYKKYEDWISIKTFILTALTIRKYMLREEDKSND